MEYVYVLKSSKDGRLYIGRTSNLRRRKNEHDHGRVKSTQHRRPLVLLFYEAFTIKSDAMRRERYLKTSKGKSTLKIMLQSLSE